jgi:hypothetical protein
MALECQIGLGQLGKPRLGIIDGDKCLLAHLGQAKAPGLGLVVSMRTPDACPVAKLLDAEGATVLNIHLSVSVAGERKQLAMAGQLSDGWQYKDFLDGLHTGFARGLYDREK